MSNAALAADALAGRVLLITGAGGGFGSALARAAAASGATVVLLGRKLPPLERVYDELVRGGAPPPALYPLDLLGASAQDHEELAQRIGEQCGALHGIVHAAARFDGLSALTHTDPLAWLEALHVNLAAPVQLSRACLPLLERSRGRLVFVLDDPQRMAKANWGAYGIAKLALAGVVAQLDQELEHAGVRAHGFLPGPMRTRLRANAYMAEDPGTLPTPDAYAAACLALLDDAAESQRGRVTTAAPP